MKYTFIVFLFSAAVATAQTLPPDSASRHVGSLTTICGNVSGTHQTAGGTTFINFGGKYPENTFTAVIFAKDTANFKTYQPVEFLKTKFVCITGMIKMHNGKPEVIIQSPDQVRMPLIVQEEK